MLRPAFTVFELLLVIGIIAVLAGVTVPAYRSYQISSDINTATEQVTQGLGRAQLKAQSGEEASEWGFYAPDATLYKGTDFAARDTSFDELFTFPSTIGVTGLTDVYFERLTGRPSMTGSIVLTSLRGDVRQVNIMIDEQGIAVNNDDKLTLCHCGGGTPKTLHLPEAAWPAHRGHGDHLGACTVPPQCG